MKHYIPSSRWGLERTMIGKSGPKLHAFSRSALHFGRLISGMLKQFFMFPDYLKISLNVTDLPQNGQPVPEILAVV